ncbi:hypothetical protein Salat_1671800 [Sesamum alatum]|uniref:Uncharacterized protein n=1 Tax=Sesamum alatum TaxID=300844 RepID=A0AAE1Y7H6_9LAMI|nr:hypothetical protein Salat_1671800 [Sesamum alatum]
MVSDQLGHTRGGQLDRGNSGHMRRRGASIFDPRLPIVPHIPGEEEGQSTSFVRSCRVSGTHEPEPHKSSNWAPTSPIGISPPPQSPRPTSNTLYKPPIYILAQTHTPRGQTQR